MNTCRHPSTTILRRATTAAAWTLLLAMATLAAADDGKLPAVRVFVLAGQSNMEGHGVVPADPARNGGRGSLEHLARRPDAADEFKRLLDDSGGWRRRDDAWIWYLDRQGPLTVGYGVKPDRIGPELGFGQVVADRLEAPVLLVKCAWGGKSLAQDFRPPSSGGETGPYYRQIVELVGKVTSDPAKHVPDLAGRRMELAGFGWHQGWNDRVNQTFNDEYAKNMANFIRDIRKDLQAPRLPFVIAETGMSGPEEKHPRALSLMRAQASVAELPEFRGDVAFVSTKEFWRPADQSPSGQAYHWNTNAETYYRIGDAMGRAMLKLEAFKP